MKKIFGCNNGKVCHVKQYFVGVLLLSKYLLTNQAGNNKTKNVPYLPLFRR